MIPWYNKLHQVAYDTRESTLSSEEIRHRMVEHFEKIEINPIGFFQRAKNPYGLKFRKDDSFVIRQTNKPRGGIDPSEASITIIKGVLIDLGQNREIKFVGQIPWMWFLGLFAAVLITYSIGLFAFIFSCLIGFIILMWFRYGVKSDMQKVDIELYKCLKEKENGSI
ncbi:hypothetical protein [Roseivirga sp. E12]|uniref:hypothetical protein n=1 Tax=Roseivirga sp. E12 TaxID=2819237 RepID=UPI001ABC72C0|nr:hypothetical protein [Roseivirga sp. E12]MBO3699597.1 hypothetical protein [Roseivirga sp. E12]